MESLSDFDWSSLQDGDKDHASLPDLFKRLQTQDSGEFITAFTQLTSTCDQPSRYTAARVAVPYLFALLEKKDTLYRSLVQRLISTFALHHPESYVPMGINMAAWVKRIADMDDLLVCDKELEKAQDLEDGRGQYRAYTAVRDHMHRMLPLVTDENIAVRSMAAYALAFFPEKRTASVDALIAQLGPESNVFVRSTIAMAIAILYRSSSLTPEEERGGKVSPDEKEQVSRRLGKLWRAHAPGTTERDTELANFSLAMARAVMGTHNLKDIQQLTSAALNPVHVLCNSVKDADCPPEYLLPFADAGLGSLAGKVLSYLQGVQSSQIVYHFAARMTGLPPNKLVFLANVVLRAALGSPQDVAKNPLPPFADLEPKPQAAIKVIADLDNSCYTYSSSGSEMADLPQLLHTWGLPTTKTNMLIWIIEKKSEDEDRSGCCTIL